MFELIEHHETKAHKVIDKTKIIPSHLALLSTCIHSLTDVVRRADDLPDVLVLLDDPRRLHVAQLDLAVREAPHQHHVLRLKSFHGSKLIMGRVD